MKKMKVLTMFIALSILFTIVGTLPMSASADGNLLVNGGFENGTTGWTIVGSTDYANLTLDPAEGDSYLAAPGLTTFYQKVNGLEPMSTYELKFQMKSSIKNAIKLYVHYYTGTTRYATSGQTYDPRFAIGKKYGDNMTEVYFGNDYTTEAERTAWKTVSFEVPIPTEHIDSAMIYIQTNTDGYLCLDDVSFTKKDTEFSYILNGDFEGALSETERGWWKNISLGGEYLVDETGNDYFHYFGTNTSAYLYAGAGYVPSGRYKFSFRAKATGTNIYYTLDARINGTTVVNDSNYFNYWSNNVSITSTDDGWATYSSYFTLPTDAAGNEQLFTLPMMLPTTRATAHMKEMWIDDIKLTRDSTVVSFNNNLTKSSFANGVWYTVRTEGYSSISNFIGKKGVGKDLPITVHYVPQEKEVSEPVCMISGLYKITDGIKKLDKISFKSASVDISDATLGKNSKGLIEISDTITLPEYVDESYLVEVYLWNTPEHLKPIKRGTLYFD